MKFIKKAALALSFFSLILGSQASAQCNNGSSWGTATAPTTGSTNISTCQYQTEYSTVNSIVSGTTYEANYSGGGCVTVTSGTPTGPVVSFGTVPHQFTATSSGTYYLHWTTDCGPACGTATNCLTSSISYVSGGGGGGCSTCATATVVGGLPFTQSNTTCGGCDNYSSLDACGSSYMNGDDYVYEYTPGVNETIDIDLTNTGTWTGVFLLDACPDAVGANCVASNTNSVGNPTITGASVNAGTTYYIVVSTFPAPQCTAFDINITQGVPVVCSDCASATSVGALPFTASATTCGACDNYSSLDACGSSYMNGDDYVYEYTPAANGFLDIDLTNTGTWTGVFLLDGCPDALGTNCVDQATNSAGNPSISNAPIVGGTTYYIVISTFPSPQCTAFDILINTPSCTDGILNQDETGVDCGGATCPACPDCNDGIQNGDETGIDCGGTSCVPCSCFNGIQDGGETGVDCGPVCGNPCPCGIVITPSTTTLPCGGGPVNLDAAGTGSTVTVLGEDFNGAVSPGWNSTGGATFGQPCGASPDGTDYYWASTSTTGVPNLTTVGFDMSCGGDICFDLVYAVQSGASPCEGPDEPDEGVSLQYSTDGGITWQLLGYFNPYTGVIESTVATASSPFLSAGQTTPFTSWNNYCFTLPAGAFSANTIFQWTQSFTSGSCCDNWGVDNVEINAISCSGYSYNWDHVPGAPNDSNQVVNPTTTTTYGVWYTDGVSDSCYQTITIEVDTLDPIVVNFTDELCGGDNTGTITVDPASGGTAPYTYAISGASTASNGSGVFTGLPQGNYTVTVTGANGCFDTETVTIGGPPPLVLTDVIVNESCDGDCDGSIDITATDGTPGYTYNWSHIGGANNMEDLNSLCDGNYSVTVTDANGCTITDNYTVTPGVVITAVIDPLGGQCLTGNSFTFNGGNSTVTSGTITNYSWDFGDASGTSGLASPTYSYGAAGTYTVTLTIGNGACTDQTTFNVTVFDMPTVTASGTNINCFGAADGTVNATGAGTSGYTYAWDIPAAGAAQAGLGAGTYTVTVTDVNGCTATDSYTVTEPTDLTATNVGVNATCFGVCDGSVNATIGGGTAGYTYSWSGGPTPTAEDQTNLCAGTYTLTVTDANGCTETTSYTVTEPTQLTASSVSTNMLCNGVCDGTLDATVGGGTAGYTYSWDGGPSTGTEDQAGVCAGTYTLTVTDANGCQATTNSTITEPAILTVTASGTNASCNGVCDGTLSSVVAGGTGVITYAWDNGAGTSATATGQCAGTYTLTVTDANGCTATDSYTVTEPALLTMTVAGTDVSCFSVCDGTLDGTTGGGTGPFVYLWDGGPSTGTEDQTSVCAGTYNLTVTDANGCTATDGYTVTEPTQLTASSVSTNMLCNGVCDGTLDATVGGGTAGYTYSWDGGPSTGTEDQTGVCAGTYTLTVTDANGCVETTSSTITEPALLTVTVTGTNVSCNGVCDGTLSSTATGGTGAITYSWDNGAGTAATASGQCANTYTLTVTDANGCTATDSYTITEPTLLTVSIAGVDASCNGVCDGTADATVAGGTGPFTYSWDDPGLSTTTNLTGLCAGTFNVTVTDASGCTATAAVVISEPTAITTTTSSTDATCGAADGDVSVVAGGGAGGYTYSWSDATPTVVGTTASVGTLPSGSYTVTVTDASGCTATDVAIINTTTGGVASAVVDNQVTCFGDCDGQATASMAGGTAPFTYLWSDGQSTATAAGLCPGNYTVDVTDFNGCTSSAAITITEPALLVAAITSQADPLCALSCDGTATASEAGGTLPTTYSWSTGGTALSETGMCDGTHTITITDANGCIATADVTLTDPPLLTAAIAMTPVSCNGVCDGALDLTTTGGTGALSYAWDNTATSEDINALCAGTFNVTVTDANGCTAVANETVTEPALLTMAVTGTDVSCFGVCDGTLDGTTGGGTGPFVYLWDGGPSTGTEDQTTVCAGTYNLTVTDANGCTATDGYTVTEPTQLTASSVSTNMLCNGVCDGTLDATVGGGTAGYTYSWDGGPSTGTEDQTGVCAGTYTLTVTDANGCVETTSSTITEPALLTVTVTGTNVSCNGVCDGTLSSTVTGGTGAITYSWDNGAGTAATASGQCANTYTLTVTDANGCTATDSYTVTEPTAIVLVGSGNDEICSLVNGDVSVVASGGTVALDYTYAWTDGGGAPIGATSTVTGLGAGTYTVVVTDDNGCTETVDVTINNQPAGTVAVTLDNQASCSGVCDGGATATMTGGTAGFTYLWDNGETTQSATALCVGSHTVDVTDANGCVVTGNITITEPNALTLTITGTDPLCNGGTDGSADATVTGGTAGYTYAWTHGPTSEDLTGVLGAGTYTLDVTDANGCTISADVTLGEPVVITSSISGNDISCNGAADGDATVVASGGTGTLVYVWSPAPGAGQGTATATGLDAVAYTVTVTDDNGCFVTETFTPTEPTAITLTPSSTTSNCGQADGSVSVVAAGGTPGAGYTYLWEDAVPNPIGVTATLTNLAAGVYTVTVTDVNGCTETTTATITDASGATLSNTFVDASCNGGSDGLIDLTVVGGTAPLTYSWTGPGGFTDANEDISNLVAGTYDVTVTDAVGCVATLSQVISEPTALVLTPASVDALCFGSSDGSVSAGTTGGTAGYTYEWYDNAALTNNVGSGTPLAGLPAGTYYVEVTDANGCTTDGQVDVNEPAAMVVTTSVVDANCGQADGSVIITGITGGSGTYVSTSWVDATPVAVPDTAAVTSGSYTVTVTDDNGCTGTGIANVNDLAGPTTNLLGVVPVSCNGGCDGSATVEANGGVGPYTYSWSPAPTTGQGTAVITDLCAGSYTVTITDANGCQDNLLVDITEPTPVDVTITASTDVSGFGLSDGTADAIGSGGTPIYTYEWFTGCPPGATTGQTGTSATGLAAGDYSVVLTDSKGCMDTTCVTILEPGAITSTLNTVDVTCFGACDGSATVSAAGGAPGYTYVWYDATATPTGHTGVTATALCAGDYYVEVTDQNSITHTSITVTITEPTIITATTAVTSNYNGQDVTCAGACDGSAQVTPSGGTPPYSYLWSDGQTSDIAVGLCAGAYSVDVTDANGCVQTFNVTVTEPLPLTNVMSATDASCFGFCDGVVTATPADGTGPYTYQWNDPGLSTSQTVSTLCAGTYDVVVTDANGCTINGSTTILEPTEIILASDSVEANCGQADGEATILIVSGDGPLTQQWDAAAGNATTATVTGLSSGCYDVTVTDNNGCTADRTVCVTDAGSPSVQILTLTDASCKDTCDGFAQIQVVPGTNSVPPLSFEWYDDLMNPIGQSTASATGLCAGDYIGEMTDANGCLATVAVTIGEPTQLVASITSSTDVTCFGDCDGVATVTAGGGTSGYTYGWNDPSNQTTATANGLCPASFTVTVTDANGCVTTVPATIGEPLQILATASSVDAFCNTGSGEASVVVDQGGVGALSYVWTPTGQTTNPATGLTPGTYDVVITDADGCTGTASTNVGNIPASVATAQVINDVSCNGVCDGEASVSLGGTGTAPYTYEWYDISGAAIGQTTQNATGLCAGQYYCIATDVNTCQSVSNTITIVEPTALTLTTSSQDVSCESGCNGSTNVIPTGGTAPYTYSWDDPLLQSDSLAIMLCPNTYNVVVTDNNGCVANESAVVGEPSEIVLDSTVVNANCGQPDGSACVIATGGVGGFTYSWPSGGTGSCEAALGAASYLVTVMDANNCSSQIVVEVSDLLGPTATITSTTDVSCFGLSDGSATVDMTGGAGTSFTVAWDANAANQTTPTASNLAAGTYTVLITDDLGCSASTSATITEPDFIIMNPQFEDPSCFGYCDGQMSVVVAGGTAPYSYQWLDAANAPIGPNSDTITGMCSGDYTLIITDANGCTEILNYTLTDPAQVSASVASTDVICNGNCDGTGTASGVVGVGTFTYQWDVAAGSQTTATATGLCPGTYNCVITDNDGCFTDVNATVTEPPLLTSSITNSGNLTCNNSCDGFAEVTPTGGTAPYTYDWSGFGITQQISGLCAGTYTAIVTDINACITTSTVIITEPAPLGATTSSTNNSCFQSCDGTGSISVSGGTLPYSYQWDDPTFATTANVNNLCAGTWTCTVTDANGCVITESVLITEPSLLSVQVNSITNANCGQANGGICVTSVGGVGPFTYQWNDPNNSTTACLTSVAANCYQVTILDAQGCTADSTICVNDITGPVVTTGAITDVSCFGAADGSIDFGVTSVTGGLTYAFYDAANNLLSSGLPVYTGLDGGTYFLQVTDAAGCIGQDVGTISEPNALNSAITSSTDVTCFGACDGQAIVSISGGSTPYVISWNDPAGQSTNLASNLCAGTWTATITDDNLCTTSASVVITEPLPLAIASTQTNVTCNGGNDGQINITASGGTPVYNYIWTPAASSGSLATTLQAGTYVVDLSDQNGCTVQSTITITEPPLLTLTYASVNSTCTQCNGAATVTVAGGTGPFTYQWLNGGNNPVGSTNTGLCPGNHTVIVTDDHGCTETIIVVVTDEPAPTIDAMSFTQPLCNGGNTGTASVVASGGTGVLTYLWDAAAGSQTSDVASALATGTYCVTVSDINGCTASNCVTVTEPSPLNSVPDGSTTICYGDSTQVWASGQGGTPGYTINWTTPGFTGTGPIMVNPLTSTDYCFTVTDANGCVSASSCVNIVVLPQLNIDMMPSTAICDGDIVDVVSSASGGNGGPYTFDWTDDQGNTHTPLGAGSPSTIQDTPGQDTWYYVTVSDGCSLDEVDSVQVTIDALPTAFLNVVDSNGCEAFTADFILNTDIGVTFDYDFECDGIVDNTTSSTNPSFTYPDAGLYDVCVTVTSADGCITNLNAPGIVEVYPVPTAGFNPDPITTSEVDPEITMWDQSSGADFYFWTFGDGDSISGVGTDIVGTANTTGTVSDPAHFYNNVGTFTVTQTVTNQYGCSDEAVSTVTIEPEQTLYVPNSFTPNGDGKNDFFIPKGQSIDAENFTMYIFNRWGEIIYETHSLNQPWDGRAKGGNIIAQTDVYVWLIKTKDLLGNDKEYKGHVTLLK